MLRFSGLLFIIATFLGSCRAPKELVYRNIDHFSMKQAGLEKTKLAMDIRLYNPNNYSLKLKSADVDVYINNRLLGKMNTNGHCSLAGCDTASLPVTLDVDMKGVLPNMLQIIMSGEVTVKLNGKIKAGRHGVYVSVPVSYEGKQDIMDSFR